MHEFRGSLPGESSDDIIEKIQERLTARGADIDILDILERWWRDRTDDILDELVPFLTEIDPHFLEDPNPIVHNHYPRVDTSEGDSSEQITFESLWRRSPYSEQERQRLRESTVGLAGFGGIQLTALTLARSGVGNFVLADHDLFEPTNANRQSLAFQHTLGKSKAAVGEEYLRSINSEINVRAVGTKIVPEHVGELYEAVDVLVDGTGDFALRKAIHEYARSSGKPIIICAWAGWEGQIATFMPDDPLFTEAFSYSPPSWDRGNDSAGVSMMDSIVAREIIKILLGDFENVVSYPYIFTFNVGRVNPVQIRNVERIKQRNERRR